MEEEINRRLDHLTRPNVFAVIVISIHVAYFLWVGMGNWTFGGGITAKALDQAGALSTDLVDRGEFWRLGASILLHANILHILLNMSNLYILLLISEPLFGQFGSLLIYGLSGYAASVLSWSVGTERTVGASGAIFGLMGAVLISAYRHRDVLSGSAGTLIRRQLLAWTIFSLLLGWLIPMIDNASHIGGVLMGGSLGIFVELKQRRLSSNRE